MADIKKIFRILIKRYWIWIAMLLAIFIILEGSVARYQSGLNFADEIYYATYELDYLDKNNGKLGLGEIRDNNSEFREISRYGLTDKYIDDYVKIFEKIIEDKGIDKSKISSGEYLDESKSENRVNEDSQYHYILYKFNGLIENERIVKDPSDGIYKMNVSDNIIRPNLLIYVIIFLLGVLFFSGEHLTKYYEFTKMFPWAKNKTYLAKVLLGIFIILGVWLISTGLKLLIFKNSNYYNLICFYMPVQKFISYGSSILAFYLIVTGIGALAGNFLGHIGMIMMAVLGIRLYQYNIWALIYMFKGNEATVYFDYTEKFIDSLNPIIKSIISPLYAFVFDGTGGVVSVVSLLALGLIFFILGLYWTNSSKSERSQMLILKENENRFVQFMAILTTANIIQLISSSLGINGITSLLIFMISLFVTYKFYNILFKARIGFQS